MHSKIVFYLVYVKYNDCISNKGLLEECDKEEGVEVMVLLLLLFGKNIVNFCPMSRIRSVSATPASR
jgi:hypothetical protein